MYMYMHIYMYMYLIQSGLSKIGRTSELLAVWGVCAGGIRGAAHKIVVGLVACGPAAASGAARDPAPEFSWSSIVVRQPSGKPRYKC